MRHLLLVACLTLAGCSGAAVEEVSGAPAGVIRGVVVDAGVAPVTDATVRVEGTDLQATSDADGAFVFTGLPPGSYFLAASKPGYQSVQAGATVVAGVAEPPLVRLQMDPVPSLVPYALPATHTGWIACEALVAMFLQPCDAGTGAFREPDNMLFLPGDDRATDAIQLELQWEAQQDVGRRLTQTIGSCDGGAYCDPYAGEDFLCQNWGPSPLWCRVTALAGEGNGHFCCAEGLHTQGHGKGTGTGVSVHVGADCSVCADPVDPALGVGIVFEQQVTAYLWSFYHFEPEPGWLFVEDGEPVPPS